ncbi:arad-like aldolase/epimerase [Myriangium duriaei CBS 260.36]|uniref:Arad-like aldolase/epimerase n=1 Tax=Myriangium duriaei CBS 260.36 TaxID=1168546 RepID=A0A9P4ITB4_9PEZI|nr:arad-like aldolase/epimerase [Myriangium duriaei CBS 260.36]
MAPHAQEDKPTNFAPHEPGVSEDAGMKMLSKMPKPPKFDDPYEARKYWKGRHAAAFRIFAKFGFDEGVAGHITLRDPVEPDTFWVNPFGTAFGLINASDLIRVNEDGEVIDGGSNRLLNTAAFMIHSAVHKARPDVMAACHSHTVHGRAFCTLGRKLDTITQDACAFHNDHVLYDSFNGVVLAEEEGRNIAKALGQNKAALLQNHGLLTVGQTVDEAVFWFVSMDKCCHSQLLAEAAAASRGDKLVHIHEEDAVFTKKTVGSHFAGYFSAKPLFDVIHKETGGEYLA